MRDGCLQDVHWALGSFGYFPTYTIGNLYAAQLVEAYERVRRLEDELAAGALRPLGGWLAENVFRHGCRLEAEEIIVAATGRGLDAEAFFRRLAARFA
jgi:carboxypeptidase Taq